MSRRRGQPHTRASDHNDDNIRLWMMDESTDHAESRSHEDLNDGVWAGTALHTRSDALWGGEDWLSGGDHTAADPTYSQYVTGASYVTITPADDTIGGAGYSTANPWAVCFIQPDSDRDDCHVAVRPGVWHLRFEGSTVEILVVLTDASTVTIAAEYGDITAARMVGWSFNDADKKSRLYIDGELVATSAAQSFGIVQSSTAVIHYGGNTTAVRPNFKGYLDSLLIPYGASGVLPTDTLFREAWLQMAGVQFPVMDSFNGPDSTDPPPDWIELRGNWVTADAEIEGPIGSTGFGATIQYPFYSQHFYFETAVWFPSNLAKAHAGLCWSITDGDDPPYGLFVAGDDHTTGDGTGVLFMTSGTEREEDLLSALGLEEPTTRATAIRLGLYVSHVHSSGNWLASVTPYVNDVAVDTAFTLAGESFRRPGLMNISKGVGAAPARFEYFYMDVTPSAPPPDYYEWVVGAVGLSRPT